MNFLGFTKNWRTRGIQGAYSLLLWLPAAVLAAQPDPLGSPMWNYLYPGFIGDGPYQFDKRVVVSAPEFAEDSSQVPITINALAFRDDLQKIVVWADLNPIQHIFTYYPDPVVEPIISLRIRVQQGTPVRADRVHLYRRDWRGLYSSHSGSRKPLLGESSRRGRVSRVHACRYNPLSLSCYPSHGYWASRRST
jgi:hypothetical protein